MTRHPHDPPEPYMGQTYRCYDDAGELLYVGVSVNAERRAGQHARNASWWEHCVEVRIDPLQPYADACQAEINLIRTLNPRFNLVRYEALT